MKTPVVWRLALVLLLALPLVVMAQQKMQRFGPVAATRLRVGDGTYVATAIGPERNAFDGFYFPSTGVAIWDANGNPSLALSGRVIAASSGAYCFAPTNNVEYAQAGNTADAGTARIQAGIVGITGCDISAGAALKIGDPGTRPTCVVALRGTFWIEEGGAGTKDDVSVCAKAADNSYAWRTIY